MNLSMLVLMLAAALIIVGTFCVVFGLDTHRSKKTRKYLLFAALICIFILWGLITYILAHPY